MKKVIGIILIIAALLVLAGCVAVNASDDNAQDSPENAQVSSVIYKTPLEWAKLEIASDERYGEKDVMWSVIPIERSGLSECEALYFIIAITEDSALTLDYYAVKLSWKADEEKVTRDKVNIDAALFKTEIIGDDGVILDYDDGKIIGDNGEVVIGGGNNG
ncbi:MAG: hypothetical protein IKB51_04025 [Clostridia bacterium]|nr:hypothetical protein [Clostridia bacterium]